eukprot:CAMPEP_0115018550 /NCGR_PEP_ID=MMETSP0216-20121206/28883_1 /TAXON_ID=223996 /ORGANISM="Protocruzia adherens, Strain Boccale" /LENGTH=597 /DNA_ID=CAMNT_0002389787 /DNA_START=607 /DNA_END=2400 /DNA_ORIENTATION=-
MGFIVDGTPLTWDQLKPKQEYIKNLVGEEFVKLNYEKNGVNDGHAMCGDEVEYTLVHFDDENEKATVYLNAVNMLTRMTEIQNEFAWRPEWGDWMIEGVPNEPYFAEFPRSLANIETLLAERREFISQQVGSDKVFPLTVTNLPRFGAGKFWTNSEENLQNPNLYPDDIDINPYSKSLFLNDRIITPHSRFRTLVRNIRERRGKKVDIRVPVFKDEFTKLPVSEENPDPNSIYMDGMGFGMGNSCLQMTFSTKSMEEATFLYDNFSVFTSYLLALSGSLPVYRGILADIDARWDVIAMSVDDRTEEEINAGEDKRVNNSRYGTIDCYISDHCFSKKEYNDVECRIHNEVYESLRKKGISEKLSRHIAHLCIRTQIIGYAHEFEGERGARDTVDFETLNSSVWNNVRFKPPPSMDSEIPWRVEFRTPDAQFTDFENAAIFVLIALIRKLILKEKNNFLIPVSKMRENMDRAVNRDAIKQEKFWFRDFNSEESERFAEMTLDEIFNGSGKWSGLCDLIKEDLTGQDPATQKLREYVDFIAKRASGEIPTNATWMRDFIVNHPNYNRDSIVTEKINYDLMKFVSEISDQSYMDAYLAKQH